MTNPSGPPPAPAWPVVDESIYDHPKYYDLVFGSDCAAEGRFIVSAAEKHGLGTPRRLFEPACGTGRLLDHLARRDYAVAGLDLNPHAVAFCNERFRRRGSDDVAVVADMADFTADDLPGSRRLYDVAFNTINSFRHLTGGRAATAHLRCVADVVRPGGLYLLGIHLTPTLVPPSDGESWSARRGHLSINTHMWFLSRDAKTRIERFGIHFDIHRPSGSMRINDVLVLRSYTPAQVRSMVRNAGRWEIAETYDFGYDIDQPVEVDGTTEDVVYVLRRV